MPLKMDAVTDSRTARLLRISKGVRMAGMVEVETGKNLVALAGAVREFAFAGEPTMALYVLDELWGVIKDHDSADCVVMFERVTDGVRKVLAQ